MTILAASIASVGYARLVALVQDKIHAFMAKRAKYIEFNSFRFYLHKFLLNLFLSSRIIVKGQGKSPIASSKVGME